jgi:hypothetical protein
MSRSARATFAAPDPSDIRDGRGLQVRLSATISRDHHQRGRRAEDSRMGLARSPHPRRSRLQRGEGHVNASTRSGAAHSQVRARRSQAPAAVASSPPSTQLVTLLPQLEGKEVVLRFVLKAGRKTRDDDGDPAVQFQRRALRTRRNRQRSRRTRNQRLLGSRNRDRTTALGPCTGLEHHFPRCSDYAAGSK